MIYTRLAGGLGNQLFQFAAALAIRECTGERIVLDTRCLSQYKTKRNYDLIRILEIPENVSCEIMKNKSEKFKASLLGYRIGRFIPYYGINDNNFSKYLMLQNKKRYPNNIWLDGYFQTGWSISKFEIVLEKIINMIRKDLRVSCDYGSYGVIHIRGNDFLKINNFDIINADYYISAISELLNRYPYLLLLHVITDDYVYATSIIEKIKNAYPNTKLSFKLLVNNLENGWVNDFMLLKDAAVRIIGNSTFAWWATALDRNNVFTISPDKWVRGAKRDLYLKSEYLIHI